MSDITGEGPSKAHETTTDHIASEPTRRSAATAARASLGELDAAKSFKTRSGWKLLWVFGFRAGPGEIWGPYDIQRPHGRS